LFKTKKKKEKKEPRHLVLDKSIDETFYEIFLKQRHLVKSEHSNFPVHLWQDPIYPERFVTEYQEDWGTNKEVIDAESPEIKEMVEKQKNSSEEKPANFKGY
jgi:hypothetical protein